MNNIKLPPRIRTKISNAMMCGNRHVGRRHILQNGFPYETGLPQ
jgi:hypothetical protein